jgi:hypothetical protein
MKTLKPLFLIASLAIMYSCTKKDACLDTICPTGSICIDGICQTVSNNIAVTSNITQDVTWTRNNVYELSGRITVENGAILTIEPGTIIKGQSGSGSNSSALLVARGGKINAVGTANLPIIFTSIADSITPEDVANGDFTSKGLTDDAQGLWGGVIILGRAPISASASEIQVEGIPTTDMNGLYGGSFPNDNSGHLEYISIRYGGTNIGSGNEINGLTLGGVGSGTTIQNIEIVNNQDDGIEFFGGNVSVTNLIIVNPADDGVDIDQAWSGTLNNFIVICGNATDHALEIDGPEGTVPGSYIVRNGSFQGSSVAEIGDYRSCPTGRNENLFFFDFPETIGGRGDLTLSNPTNSTCTTDNYVNDVLIFSNLEVILPSNTLLSNVFLNGVDAAARSVTSKSVGANVMAFSWTFTSQKNLLTNKF